MWAQHEEVRASGEMFAQTKKVRASQKMRKPKGFALPKKCLRKPQKVLASTKMFAQTKKVRASQKCLRKTKGFVLHEECSRKPKWFALKVLLLPLSVAKLEKMLYNKRAVLRVFVHYSDFLIKWLILCPI